MSVTRGSRRVAGQAFVLRKKLELVSSSNSMFFHCFFFLPEATSRFDKIRESLRLSGEYWIMFSFSLKRYRYRGLIISPLRSSSNERSTQHVFSLCTYYVIHRRGCMYAHVCTYTYTEERLRNQAWPRNSCRRQKWIKKKRASIPRRNRILFSVLAEKY